MTAASTAPAPSRRETTHVRIRRDALRRAKTAVGAGYYPTLHDFTSAAIEEKLERDGVLHAVDQLIEQVHQEAGVSPARDEAQR